MRDGLAGCATVTRARVGWASVLAHAAWSAGAAPRKACGGRYGASRGGLLDAGVACSHRRCALRAGPHFLLSRQKKVSKENAMTASDRFDGAIGAAAFGNRGYRRKFQRQMLTAKVFVGAASAANASETAPTYALQKFIPRRTATPFIPHKFHQHANRILPAYAPALPSTGRASRYAPPGSDRRRIFHTVVPNCRVSEPVL